ncbi:MAG: type IV pilus twitching motility protein PilT [Candidatus Omnitrophica bacterium]|nr:type IV pilus twitching motility protein PilT [Candidatus Omnitrophota bacterium]MBU4488036.1 type IV pilus twitching motility protein PilT [Candidatus Omnitrophota bacterium]MCG2704722.1 type IV pilus twitching motility protein PilT [Candidatus Omnitrophota bacterium]
MEIDQLLQICIERNASDIHLTVGKPPTLRVDGMLDPLDYNPLSANDTEALIKSITSESHLQKVQKFGGADFGLSFGDVARFRVSVYKQKGYWGTSLRLIPSKLLTFEEIGLPLSVKELLHRPRGLILVTGPTGGGKTSTLASMTDYVNTNRDAHIITIEDPIEYYHEHKRGIITQRELGVDVYSFSEAIVRGLRMNPDVILVGEMRDLATIEAAILAAETGHLVLATLHTTSAAQTVDRIINVFPPQQQEQVRMQLSTSILAIFCQQLLIKATKKGRVAAFEIMITTSSIQNLIREKKTFRITSDIQTGAKYGMKTFDSSLVELYQRNLIDYETMLLKAFEPDQIELRFQKGRK